MNEGHFLRRDSKSIDQVLLRDGGDRDNVIGAFAVAPFQAGRHSRRLFREKLVDYIVHRQDKRMRCRIFRLRIISVMNNGGRSPGGGATADCLVKLETIIPQRAKFWNVKSRPDGQMPQMPIEMNPSDSFCRQ